MFKYYLYAIIAFIHILKYHISYSYSYIYIFFLSNVMGISHFLLVFVLNITF